MQDTSFQPCCLIVEDQALIGMALEAYLGEMGLAVAGPFPSGGEAQEWLASHTPGLALLDFTLKDGPSTELVRVLRGRGVPIVIYSGHRPGRDTPPEFDGVPWIEKPIDRADLLKALAQCAPSLIRCAPPGAS